MTVAAVRPYRRHLPQASCSQRRGLPLVLTLRNLLLPASGGANRILLERLGGKTRPPSGFNVTDSKRLGKVRAHS